jgi:hypothetical protein
MMGSDGGDYESFLGSAAELQSVLGDLGMLEDGAYETLLVEQCVLYGKDDDPGRLDRVHALYTAWMEWTQPADRLRTLQTVCRAIRDRVTESNALISFIYMEDDLAVLSAAALNLALLYEPEDELPLPGPRFVKMLAGEAQDDIQKAGLLAGLLLLGDQQVLPLLHGCWRGLGFQGQQRLAAVWSGPAYAATVQFLLGWLEEAEGAEFTKVARTLARIPREASPSRVLDVEYAYPTRDEGRMAGGVDVRGLRPGHRSPPAGARLKGGRGRIAGAADGGGGVGDFDAAGGRTRTTNAGLFASPGGTGRVVASRLQRIRQWLRGACIFVGAV